MSAFHKMIATVKSALEGAPHAPAPHAPTPPVATVVAAPAARPIVPRAQHTRRTELTAQFARELEAVGGVFLGAFAPDDVRARVVALARELSARTAAIGAGVTLDADPIARALEHAGVRVVQPGAINGAGADDSARATYREHLANCDLGIAEAEAGIAATGTLAVVGAPNRPNSLTLLPPTNLIIINADRMWPDLAAAVSAIGAATFTSKRVALITGPSRTADIEKMIVLGVHGPKKLYALMVWPHGA
ncbi:MAG TPA: LUD domain-containing protein [Candidatus Binataceae bacterium]